MKSLIFGALLLTLFMSGCLCPERATLTAVYGITDLIGLEYTEYVSGDPSLNEDSKVTRIRSVELLMKALREGGIKKK